MYLHDTQIEYKSQQIHWLNYSNMSTQDFVQVMEHNSQLVAEQQEQDLLVLIDVTNVDANKDVLDCCKRCTKIIDSHTKRMAVLGIPKIVNIFLNYLSSVSKMELRFFSDRVKAKEWLVQD